MIRVALVDDDALVRRLLTTILSGDGIDVVAEATDGDEVVTMVHAHRPDVVIMDLRMARMDGMAAIHALRRLPVSPAVLALTSLGADQVAVDAVRAGAEGFLTKDADPGEIRGAVHALASGEGWLSPRAARLLVAEVASDHRQDAVARAASLVATLTDRERDVAVAVAAGATNGEIARLLHLGEATVKTHLARAMGKLGVENRTALAIVVDRAGLGPA